MNIRNATLNDIEVLSKVHIDTWLNTYRGLIPDEYLNKLSYEKSKKMFHHLISNRVNLHIVAEVDGEVVGYASFGKERTNQYTYKGEMQAIYILKEYQGSGIGKQLFSRVIKELSNQGINSLMIWVLDGNSSTSFYKTLGGLIIDEKYENFGGVTLKELAFGWTSSDLELYKK